MSVDDLQWCIVAVLLVKVWAVAVVTDRNERRRANLSTCQCTACKPPKEKV